MISRPIVFGQFVGRSNEIAHLSDRKRSASALHGGVVLISGLAGIGKTRLVDEFLAPLQRGTTRVARVRCHGFASSAFADFESAARALVPHFEPRPDAGDAVRLADLLPTLQESAARRTTIIAIEDLQSASLAFFEILNAVAEIARQRRLLVIATYRQNEIVATDPRFVPLGRLLRDDATSRITLGTLETDIVESLIRRTLRELELEPTLSIAAVVEIAVRSEGNPLFVRELLRHAIDFEADDRKLPDVIRAIVHERLAGCTIEERALLSAASLCGRRFDREQISSVLKFDQSLIDTTLAHLVALDLIEAAGGARFEFHQALTRDALYAEIPRREAIPAHRKIARQLESQASREREIAHHRWNAGERDEDAGVAYERAANAARRDLLLAEAILWYERALEAFQQSPEAAMRVSIALGTTLMTADETSLAFTAYERAIELARGLHDMDAVVRVRKLVAGRMSNDGRRQAAIDLLERTLEELSENDSPDRRAQIVVRIAQYQALKQDRSDARRSLDRVDLVTLEADPAARAEYYSLRSMLAAQRYDIPAWEDGFRSSLALYEQLQRPMFVRFAHVNMAWQAWAIGDLARARIHVAIAAEASAESAAPLDDVPLTLAMISLAQGDVAQAGASLDTVRGASDFMSRHLRAIANVELGVAISDDARVRRFLDHSLLDEAASIDTATGFVRLACAFAAAHRSVGENGESARLYERAARKIESTYEFVSSICEIARYLPERARTLRAILTSDATCASAKLVRAATSLVDAEIADRSKDRAAARSAGTHAYGDFLELGWRPLAARAAELAGDSRAALDLYRACGLLSETRRFANLDRPDFDASRTDLLTMRERQVADLICNGATNRAAALSMSISHKTIEKHLASVYEKLGIASRAELRVQLGRERGIISSR